MQERPGEVAPDRAEVRAQGRGGECGVRGRCRRGDAGPRAFSSDSFPAFWEPGNEVSAARWRDS